MKLLRTVAALLVALALAVLVVRARNGVETDLYGIADARRGSVLGDIAVGMAGQGRILYEGGDFAELKAAAQTNAAAFVITVAQDFQETLDYLDSRKSGLLAPETRRLLLEGRFHEVAEAAADRLYSPAPPLFSVKDDPFLLASEYAMSLQGGLAGDWTMREGFPVYERADGRIFLLQSLGLAAVPPPRLVDFLRRNMERNAGPDDAMKVWCSGPAFHAACAFVRSQREIGILSVASVVCVLFVGWLLFRSLRFVPWLLLAQGSGLVFAGAAVFLAFDRPHVLTFVFGTSLIGLSVDYVYHARVAGDVRRVFRPLTLSLLTTVACFAPLLFADVVVLRQMALFSIAGLLGSYGVVLLLPAGRPVERRLPPVCAAIIPVRRTPLHRAVLACSVLAILVLVAGLVRVESVPVAGPQGPDGGAAVTRLKVDWRVKATNDPAAFYRPDDRLIVGEQKLAAVSPGQAQRFAFVRGDTVQQALENEEALGVRGLSAVIPSLKRQRENAALVARLVQAEGSNYTEQTGLKMPASPREGFLDPERLADGPLLQMVRSMRVTGGLVSPLPAGAGPVAAGVEVLEPRATLERMFGTFTAATEVLLAWSFGAFALLLALAFGRRVLHYMAPVAMTLVATAGVLGWAGIPVTFFTYLCFFVLAGLGIDYAIFHLSAPSPETRRTVLYAFLTSFVGFGMLSFTDFPVTHAMGVTFAVGLFFAYAFSLVNVFLGWTGPVADAEDGDAGAWHRQAEQSAGHCRVRIMWYLYAWFGKGLLKVVTVPVMACIYPFAKPARRALDAFYAVLAADCAARGEPAPRPRPFRHLLGFAWSLADKTDACTLKKNLPRMTVRDDAGWRAFRSLTAAGRGAFLVSTHVGTVEVLPALPRALDETSIPHVHAFQQMGHDAVFTRMFMRRFDATRLTLHAVEDIGVETAVRMQEAIGRGELVLMAGDRVSAGSGKTLAHDFLGRPCRWPKGVFAFAKLMESPVFFVTCVRTGWNAYETRFRLFDPDAGAGAPTARMLDQYVAFLSEEVREHPGQWYQFYDFFGDRAK